MFDPFLAITAVVVPLLFRNETVSPTEGEDGNVKVNDAVNI